jgi:hypothetical protein
MPLAAFNLDKMQGQSIALTPQPPLPQGERGGKKSPSPPRPRSHKGRGGVRAG